MPDTPDSTLTLKQAAVLTFLRDHKRRNGFMPSTREIQRHFSFASNSAAICHLRVLERKGRIVRHPGQHRGLAFPEDLTAA